MKYNPEWNKKDLKCYFCGTKLSVKYLVIIKEGDLEQEVCCCNRCVFQNEVK